MAIVTVRLIQDRLFAINDALSDINAVRYFPDNVDSSKFPFVFVLPTRRVRNTTSSGAEIDNSTRTFMVTIILNAWLAGIPTKSSQILAEAMLDTLSDEYIANPMLKLAGSPLDGIVGSVLRTDSGIDRYRNEPSLAAIEIPLEITYNRPIVRK